MKLSLIVSLLRKHTNFCSNFLTEIKRIKGRYIKDSLFVLAELEVMKNNSTFCKHLFQWY